MSEEFDDVDQRLEEIEDRIREAGQICLNKTEIRLAREGRRLAKQEHRLIPYLSFSFHLINSADDVLAMNQGCEVAVEMIALLEDEERARQFQPDLPIDEYEHTKWWMTGFTYKKLATLTGHTQGYNSDGMHQCIADGMNVCRRTGNLRDTLHFREFAVEVYRAADDLDMALHFARGSLQLQDSDDSNRRVASADDVASILALQGNLTAAMEMVQQGWVYCQQFHNPYLAQLNFLPLAREVSCLAGRQDLFDALPVIVAAEEVTNLPAAQVLRIPPEEECPYFKFLMDESQAAEAACRGEFDRAIQLLQPWDRSLSQEQCLTRWFGVRCRLVAACRLAGRMDQARRLAKDCEDTARKSHDWLTMRRLARLMDESIPATPLALVGEPDCGPFAMCNSATDVVARHDEPSAMQSAEQGESTEQSPLAETIASFYERLHASEGAVEIVSEVAAEIRAIEPDSIANAQDASRLLHLIRFVTAAPQSRDVLAWADQIVKRWPTDATILSMYAALAAHLRSLTDSELDDVITIPQIEALFRQSLDLDVNSAGNFARAGMYHLARENYGEAERCLARAHRLDRTSPIVASSLAEVYSVTDRPRDALAVLDMALREGCEDPQVAWEAALRSNSLEQFDAVLAYMDRYDAQDPGRPWTNHYRAFALLELNRPDEALAALEREAEFNPEATYPVQLQRTTAFGQLGQDELFRQHLTALLDIPMTSVTYLSPGGLQRMFHRLWSSSGLLSTSDPLRRLLEDHLVSTGLAANDLFDALRIPTDGSEPDGEVRFYSLLVRQPLDKQWRTSRGCLAGEEDWTAYTISWGVLARDEQDARQRVLEWQRRSYHLPAEIREVEPGEETYLDFPGVVWQGRRDGLLGTATDH